MGDLFGYGLSAGEYIGERPMDIHGGIGGKGHIVVMRTRASFLVGWYSRDRQLDHALLSMVSCTLLTAQDSVRRFQMHKRAVMPGHSLLFPDSQIVNLT